MNSSKKKIIAFAMSITVFSTPFMAATPCYADPQLEQINPHKQSEKTSGNNESFTERLKKKQAAIQASTIPAGQAYVPANTQLNVEIVNELTSKKAKKGDLVRFKLLDNLIINNVVVVPSGSEVDGKVTEATSSGFFGRAGKLIFSIDKVRTINGVDIPLEYMGKIEAGSDGGAIAVVAVVSLIGGFFMKGKNVNIPAGTKFAAKVANNTDLNTTLKDLPNAMNPSKPHGVSVTIQ